MRLLLANSLVVPTGTELELDESTRTLRGSVVLGDHVIDVVLPLALAVQHPAVVADPESLLTQRRVRVFVSLNTGQGEAIGKWEGADPVEMVVNSILSMCDRRRVPLMEREELPEGVVSLLFPVDAVPYLMRFNGIMAHRYKKVVLLINVTVVDADANGNRCRMLVADWDHDHGQVYRAIYGHSDALPFSKAIGGFIDAPGRGIPAPPPPTLSDQAVPAAVQHLKVVRDKKSRSKSSKSRN